MKIKKFEAKGVHGYLEYDIEFKERITFLIGINGSGKTSVLKLILGLISPSFNFLNSIDFEYAKLYCSDTDIGDILIYAVKDEDENYSLTLRINETDPIIGKINKVSQIKLNEYRNDDMTEKLREIIDLFNEQEVVLKIKELTTPLFLGLDRRVYEGQQIDRMRQNYLIRRRYRHYPQSEPLNLSLIDVQELINDYIRIIASKQPKINQDFKNKILLQSFEFTESQDLNLVQDLNDLEEKRKQALEAFDNLKISGFNEHVNKYFDQLNSVLKQLREIQNKTGKKIESENFEIFQKWFNNQPQLKRIKELIVFNEAYQEEIKKLYQPIEKTENLINTFFSESGKELKINPDGEIQVDFLNRKKEGKIFELSSGEKQIITMLVHLIFFAERYKKKQGIFIIDEPEVSLHLAWQELFTESLLESSPNTQFILATHSPAIIGDAPEENCQDLAKLNID